MLVGPPQPHYALPLSHPSNPSTPRWRPQQSEPHAAPSRRRDENGGEPLLKEEAAREERNGRKWEDELAEEVNDEDLEECEEWDCGVRYVDDTVDDVEDADEYGAEVFKP